MHWRFMLCMIAFCQSVLLKRWWWWWWRLTYGVTAAARKETLTRWPCHCSWRDKTLIIYWLVCTLNWCSHSHRSYLWSFITNSPSSSPPTLRLPRAESGASQVPHLVGETAQCRVPRSHAGVSPICDRHVACLVSVYRPAFNSVPVVLQNKVCRCQKCAVFLQFCARWSRRWLPANTPWRITCWFWRRTTSIKPWGNLKPPSLSSSVSRTYDIWFMQQNAVL